MENILVNGDDNYFSRQFLRWLATSFCFSKSAFQAIIVKNCSPIHDNYGNTASLCIFLLIFATRLVKCVKTQNRLSSECYEGRLSELSLTEIWKMEVTKVMSKNVHATWYFNPNTGLSYHWGVDFACYLSRAIQKPQRWGASVR